MTIFIHTSGTSVLDDDAKGAFKTERIYHDDERSEIDSVLDDAPHRQIDLAIVAAQKELHEKAKLAIMIPLLIYGSKWQAFDRLALIIMKAVLTMRSDQGHTTVGRSKSQYSPALLSKMATHLW